MTIEQETLNAPDVYIRKAMAYDLLIILEENGKKAYTTEEVKQLIHTYIEEYLKQAVS